MFQEYITAKGDLIIVLSDSTTGEIKLTREEKNIVVSTGKNYIASRMKDTGIPTQMTYMGIGSNTQTAAVTDTGLYGYLANVALTTPGGVVTSNTVQYVGSYPAGTGTGAVVEAGVFGSLGGTMLCRTVFPVVNKSANDTMTITWNVTLV
jgi:hypothetical protein